MSLRLTQKRHFLFYFAFCLAQPNFRLHDDDKIGYQYDLRNTKQLCSQSPRSSLLLTSREGCYANVFAVTGNNLKPANWN